MEANPRKGTVLKAVSIAVLVATLVVGALRLFIPELPAFAYVSAWGGTAFTLAIWILIYR